MRVLVIGGARSGKSSYAEQLVTTDDCVYVATARPDPSDADFAARISQHQRRRPASWHTEDQLDAVDVLRAAPTTTVVLDDVGTWITHVIDRRQAWSSPRGTIEPDCAALAEAVAQFPNHHDLIIVTPEVGMGIISEHYSGRLFRDELGALNTTLATVCDRVVLVIAGQPLELKTPTQH